MLTRLFIDNFRCLVKFEYRPSRKQVILGRNGSGKSTLLDALLFVRQFVTRGDTFDDHFILSQRTQWLTQRQVTFELEATLDNQCYVYRLVVEPWGEPPRPRVFSETLQLEGKPIFEFVAGEVRLHNDRLEPTVNYPFDPSRSALATISPGSDNLKLGRFKRWLAGLFCFRINPFAMGARADTEDLYPNLNLLNIAAWYRHLVQAYPKQNAALIDSLRLAIDDFSFLGLDPIGENVRVLFAEFIQANGPSIKLYFNQLSDGQRCLICLYTILHFVLATGCTVILDEPDNFIALREIQPWLMSVADIVDEGMGQILLISHHPELINQWAPSSGIEFVREGIGPVSVRGFQGDPSTHLSPAELVARGWERE